MSTKTSPAGNDSVENYESKCPSSRSLFRRFIESTTLHGIHNLYDSGSRLRQFIWLLCLTGSTTVFLKFTSDLVSSYLSYDVVTRVTLVNQDFSTFPAVTICNFNPMRKDYLKRNNLTKFMSIIRSMFDDDNESVESDGVGKVFNTSMEDVVRDSGHKMEFGHMFASCTFQGKECLPQDFTPVFTRMGLCYTFNKEKNSSFAIIRNPGDDFGLTLTLSVEQDKYHGILSFISGFKIQIHGQDELPLVKEHGFAVMPGTSTFVAVTRKRVKSLPAPFKTKCENKKLQGTSVYSKPLCNEACRVAFIVDKCGCRDAEMSEAFNVRVCTFREKVECVIAQEAAFIQQAMIQNCSCPTPCDLTSFETRLSYAQYPSEHAKESLAPVYGKKFFGNQTTQEIREGIYRNMGQNLVQIKIFLQDLNYNFIEDIPKYKLESLLAEAGGMLGLLLGASVLTVVEFFDFLLSLLALKCRK